MAASPDELRELLKTTPSAPGTIQTLSGAATTNAAPAGTAQPPAAQNLTGVPAASPAPPPLIPTQQTTPTTPAAETAQTPPGQVTTAPVVAAPVLSTVQENETVAGQLRTLLATGNPLLEQSKQRALIHAGSRGLQNSLMASQAGEEAFISAALPIASQDASTQAQRALVNQQTQNEFGGRAQTFEYNADLQRQGHLENMVQLAAQGDINSRLQLEQAGYNSALSVQENLQRMEEIARQGDQNARIALMEFNHQSLMADKAQGFTLQLEDKRFQQAQEMLVQDYAQRLGLTQAESQLMIERMQAQHQMTLDEITANAAASGTADAKRAALSLQSEYLSSVVTRQLQASAEIQTIFTTQGLTSAQQNAAVASARARLEADILALSAYYRQSPLWDSSWGTPGVGGTAPAPTPPGQIPAPGAPPAPPGSPIGAPPSRIPTPVGPRGLLP